MTRTDGNVVDKFARQTSVFAKTRLLDSLIERAESASDLNDFVKFMRQMKRELNEQAEMAEKD